MASPEEAACDDAAAPPAEEVAQGAFHRGGGDVGERGGVR